jgi:hypothetical protein
MQFSRFLRSIAVSDCAASYYAGQRPALSHECVSLKVIEKSDWFGPCIRSIVPSSGRQGLKPPEACTEYVEVTGSRSRKSDRCHLVVKERLITAQNINF